MQQDELVDLAGADEGLEDPEDLLLGVLLAGDLARAVVEGRVEEPEAPAGADGRLDLVAPEVEEGVADELRARAGVGVGIPEEQLEPLLEGEDHPVPGEDRLDLGSDGPEVALGVHVEPPAPRGGASPPVPPGYRHFNRGRGRVGTLAAPFPPS